MFLEENSSLTIDLSATFFDIATRNSSYKFENNNKNN